MAAAPRTCAKLSSILIAHDAAASQCTKDSRPKLIVVTEASPVATTASAPSFYRSATLPRSSVPPMPISIPTGSQTVPPSPTQPQSQLAPSPSDLRMLHVLPIPPSPHFDAAAASSTLRGQSGYVSFCDVAGLGAPSLDDEPEDDGLVSTPRPSASPSAWLPNWLWVGH